MQTHSGVLTSKAKRLLHEALSLRFAQDPEYGDKIKVVNRRSDLTEFPYGIILRGISGSTINLSADNYFGAVNSYVSMAQAENHPSMFLNHVSEDDNNLYWYIRAEDVSDQADGMNKVITVATQPMIAQDKRTGALTRNIMPDNVQVKVDNVPVEVVSVNGELGQIIVKKPLPANGTVTIAYLARRLADPGYYYLEMVSPGQIYIGKKLAAERFPIYPLARNVQIRLTPDYLKQNTITIEVDGEEVTSGYEANPGSDSIYFLDRPQGSNLQILNRVSQTPLVAGQDWFYLKYTEEVLLPAAIGNEIFLPLTHSSAESIKLYIDGQLLNPRVNGNSEYDYEIINGVIKLRRFPYSSGKVVASYLYPDTTVSNTVAVADIFDDATLIEIPDINPWVPNFFEVYIDGVLQNQNTYSVDYAQKRITLYKVPQPGQFYEVSYRLNAGTIGPFAVEKNASYNNIIPGVVLHFGHNFKTGDKVVVLVGENRKTCVDEYGGQFDISVEMTVVSPDPQTTERISDDLVLYLSSVLKSYYSGIGIELSDINHNGESEEVLYESTQDTDFQVSIGFKMLCEWYTHVPRPYRIMSTTTQAQPAFNWKPPGKTYPDFTNPDPIFSKYTQARIG